MKTRIGIVGYGNLGRGVEMAIAQNPDMELAGVFTRRDPSSVKIATEGVQVYPFKRGGKEKRGNRRHDPLRRQRYRPARADTGAGS